MRLQELASLLTTDGLSDLQKNMMRNMKQFAMTILATFALAVTAFSTQAFAQIDNFTPFGDDLVACYGDKGDGCKLYIGTPASCARLAPCRPNPEPEYYWCWGLNPSGECVLSLGTLESCENATPCSNELNALRAVE